MIVMMMCRSAPQMILFFALLLIYSTGSLGSNSGVGEPKIRCKGEERRALLRIKEDIYNSTDATVLSSWGNEGGNRECCEWSGISCDNKSSHVIKLDLSNEKAGLFLGNLSSSLVVLQRLNFLDLSNLNNVDGNFIPSFIGRLSKLRYLNFSETRLEGEILPQIGNLSNLQYLDLSLTDLKIKNLEPISHLSSLRLLDLSGTNLSMAHDWVHVVNNLPRLTILNLGESELPDIVPPSLSLLNSSKFLAILDLNYNQLSTSVFLWLFNYSRSLVHLDLSNSLFNASIPKAFGNLAALEYLDLHVSGGAYIDEVNQLKGPIPKSFENMTALVHLDLSSNQLRGSIPEGFGNMTFLQHLDLSRNMLSGEIPESIWKICALREFHAHNNSLSGPLQFAESTSRCTNFPLEILDLEENRIVGSLPNFTLYPSLKELWLNSNELNGNVSKSLGQLSKLKFLRISDNFMADVMSEAHFSKLFNLSLLDLSSNSHIVIDVSSDWIPPFQLKYVELGGCKLGPPFPKWLLTQNSMFELNISNSGISDSIPDTLWNRFQPDIDENPILDLSDNEIRGTIRENQAPTMNSIDLSSNNLEGPIPSFLFQVPSLNLFNNTFSNMNSICNHPSYMLSILDVSYNQLSGELPDCWSQLDLRILILGNNKLSGKIPSSLGFLPDLKILHLGNNNLTATLPPSLQNCTELLIFDVGENNLSGPVPAWIGISLTKLVILSLRSNNFTGSMPIELCGLADLQLLDLSLNNLSSSIPNCLNNITAMKAIAGNDSEIKDAYNDFEGAGLGFVPSDFYNENLFLVWKGALLAFKNLGHLKSIDLSSNRLWGDIPREITRLVGLVSLNLSRNNLSGQIPQEIGKLQSLDALDLSMNHLLGRIPSSLSQIDRLNALDLSCNNLSGKIPSGPQLQSRDPAAYVGNIGLCGIPLPNKCPGEEEPRIYAATEDHANDEERDEIFTKGFYISTTVGFIVGFWGVCFTFIFNKSWRYGYFKSLDRAGDWLYVTAAVHKARLMRVIKS